MASLSDKKILRLLNELAKQPIQFKKLMEAAKPDVVIEAIPQNIRSGEPALGFMRTALDMGINVVTSNKAAIVLGYILFVVFINGQEYNEGDILTAEGAKLAAITPDGIVVDFGDRRVLLSRNR